MKHSFYIGIVFSLVSAYCYSQPFDIEEKYRGNSFFSRVNMQKLWKDCTLPLDFEELDVSKQTEIRNRCQLYNFSSYFDNVYDLIDKRTVIYQKNDLTLRLSKENFSFKQEDDYYSGVKLILFLIKNNEIKDRITLANYFTNETTLLSVGYQYFYISPSGDIYTLSLIEMDDGIGPQRWRHYKIDVKNLKFHLAQIYDFRHQVTYPDNFTILPDPEQDKYYKKEQFEKCLKDESEDFCDIEDVYFYYLDQIKQKTVQLARKNNSTKNLFSPLKKNRDKLCLSQNEFLINNELFPYFDDIVLCEIKQLKQEIKRVEIELAK
ncbi:MULTISPECIES: hypothetical protein [unclassified Gilliamella]|uniref:hypothetical protein n=1 Tax=unclassified Gilliamella TaxID=2685620 RepID=UPI00080EC7D5|nr:hypothetical protein [Gilliamella apicola]OCG19304.1 hypothetical protein A9G23_09200 [Gilliamella apicola]OCG22387.1 hypothetical protein A9G22_07405 [Gilliamella apicola]